MKPLELLTIREKGMVLHQLFPQEIPALLDFTLQLCETIREQTPPAPGIWDKGLVTIEEASKTIQSIKDDIGYYYDDLRESSDLFGDYLFDGKEGAFMVYCLAQFTVSHKHPNLKFIQAVSFLFL